MHASAGGIRGFGCPSALTSMAIPLGRSANANGVWSPKIKVAANKVESAGSGQMSPQRAGLCRGKKKAAVPAAVAKRTRLLHSLSTKCDNANLCCVAEAKNKGKQDVKKRKKERKKLKPSARLVKKTNTHTHTYAHTHTYIHTLTHFFSLSLSLSLSLCAHCSPMILRALHPSSKTEQARPGQAWLNIASLSTLLLFQHCFSFNTASLSTLPLSQHCLSLSIASLSTLPLFQHCLFLNTASLSTLTLFQHCLSLTTASLSPLPRLASPFSTSLFPFCFQHSSKPKLSLSLSLSSPLHSQQR